MYLAKGDNQTAAKYFEGAAVQLRDYIEELYGEEEAEAKEWLLQLVTHAKEIRRAAVNKSSVKTEGESFALPKGEIPSVSFDDVAGLKSVKERIYDMIIYPRQYRELYKRFNKRLGGGILLYGPPGNGKTMIAKAISKETGSTFFPIKFSDIGSKWFGETEERIKALFDEARKAESAVIFFDEIDAIASQRGDSEVSGRMVAELLAQLDGINKSQGNITVLAATNRPEILDPAIVRPGRFDERIYIPQPDLEARESMLRSRLSVIPCEALPYTLLAQSCEGMSGAEINLACEKAKQSVIRRIIHGAPDSTLVSAQDILDAIKSVKSY